MLCDAALRNTCSLNIQQKPFNDCKSQNTAFLTSILEINIF